MIGYYNYTVIMTYLSLVISSIGICLGATGRPFEAIICLMASGICDMFDGKIARTRKKSTEEEKRFGIQLDSLCDIVCFGVLPAVIGVAITPAGSPAHYIAWGLGALYILCALIRLAYFNVTEETRQSTETGCRTHYAGLPVTTAAVIFPLAFVLYLFLPASLRLWTYPIFCGVTAVCFIAPIRVRKPHGVGLLLLGLIGLCEFGGLLYFYLR